MKLHITDKYKSIGGFYQCECGRCFEKSLQLSAHFGHCEKHHEILGYEVCSYYKGHPGNMSGWQNKTKEEIKEIHKKAGITRASRHYLGTFLGRHHTEESKRKKREAAIKYIQENCGGCRPRASKKQCEYLDNLAKEKGWCIQHARNGGEFSICGYFVDGYDKERNIVIEYDEKAHYIDLETNKLREKDILRQNNIIKELKCRFLRYNEATNNLYEVNLID